MEKIITCPLDISDRIPRPIIPGEKRELNKRIVEKLAYKLHLLELENASSSQIWAYRKAAWAVEDLEQDVGLVYRSLGRKGLGEHSRRQLHSSQGKLKLSLLQS